MKAMYYRFLFHNTGEGICYTGSIADQYTNQSCNFIFISGLRDAACGKGEPDKRFVGTQYQLMFLADLTAYSVGQAVYTLKNSKVSKVVVPEYSPEDLKACAGKMSGCSSAEERDFLADPYQYMENAGVNEICRIQSEESFVCSRWMFKAAVFGDGASKSLAVFHGPADIDKKQDDILMAVKYFSGQEPCSVCIEPKKASCGMKCGLYNDFDICKKHNEAGEAQYIDGCLLLGSVDLQKEYDAVHKCFEDVWNKIRFVQVPNGGIRGEWNKNILSADPGKYKQYFVMPGTDADCMEAIRDISFESPYKQLAVMSEDFGLCCSGFYKHRDNK